MMLPLTTKIVVTMLKVSGSPKLQRLMSPGTLFCKEFIGYPSKRTMGLLPDRPTMPAQAGGVAKIKILK